LSGIAALYDSTLKHVAIHLAYGAIAVTLAIFTVALLVFIWKQLSGFAFGEYRREEIFRASDPEDLPPYLQVSSQRLLAILRQLLSSSARRAVLVLLILCSMAYYGLFIVLAQPRFQPPIADRLNAFSDENIVRMLKDQTAAQESIAGAIKQQNDNIKNIEGAIRSQSNPGSSSIVVIPQLESRALERISNSWPILTILTLLIIVPSVMLGFLFLSFREEPSFGEPRPPRSIAAKSFVRATASTITLASISIGTLITVKELNLFTFNITMRSGQDNSASIQKVTINFPQRPDKKTHTDCGIPAPKEANREQNTMRVGPFPICVARPEDIPAGDLEIQKAFEVTSSSLIAIADHIKEHKDRAKLIGLTLIGSFDKRSLKAACKKKFGENAGLAMSRANWVKEQLVDQYKAAEVAEIVATTAGPGQTELNENGQMMSTNITTPQNFGDLDRAVQVCATWEETP
jgi:hypothetical protein